MGKQHGYCGECIFCNSKCPLCGSINVNIDFKLQYSYSNGAENHILCNTTEPAEIEMECYDCGEFVEDDDERLFGLRKAIESAMPNALECKWSDGKVSTALINYETDVG